MQLVAGGHRYTKPDALNTVRWLGVWWELLVAGRGDPSAAEAAAAPLVARQAMLLGAAGTDVGAVRAAAVVEHRRLTRVAWDDATIAGASQLIAGSMALLHEAGRVLHDAGIGPASQRGRVVQVNSSDGGVPKRAVDELAVSPERLSGDRQATRRHHGRPWQRLCLWSAEVIDGLRAEGHPIEPGFAGENLTIAGIDWRDVVPGVQLRIGPVLAEASLYALPCAQNAPWFVGGDFERMHHERERGVSRMYATVLESGVVRAGDVVVLEP